MAIIGDAEFIEFRFESISARLRRTRRRMKKMRIPVATMAKKPKTTITAMAQRGNELELESDCTFPVEEGKRVVAVPSIVVTNEPELRDDEMDASDEESAAEERDARDDDDAAAAAAEEEDATTSATVV